MMGSFVRTLVILTERRVIKVEQEASARQAVYGYARISTGGQTSERQSLDVQQRQLEGWAMQRGWKLSETVVDAGASGGVPFAERPEGRKLWARLQRRDVLVASKLDRLFRSAADCLHVVEELKARGVSLFLLDLNGGADDVSGNGIARLFLTIVSAFAEFERDRIGERIRAAKRVQKARGEYLGGPVPFGWSYTDDGKLVPIAEQQAALERIQELHAQGLSLRKISADLARNGHKLSHVTVGNILSQRGAG
jgi:putative DNA-invertase from lambdoid prophage Rac